MVSQWPIRGARPASLRRSSGISCSCSFVLNGEVSPGFGFDLAPWQGPTKAFHLGAAPRSRGNRCNSACARLYNAFPLKFDPLRLRLRAKTCERAQTVIKELPFMSDAPLMPKATAVWLVENTSLTFDQIAEFCKLHPLEVKGIADGEVATGIKGYDPISTGQLPRGEIAAGETDPNHRLHLST